MTIAATHSKESVAAHLARRHFDIEPGLQRIVRLLRPGHEDDHGEPLKLLEVNEYTTPDGILPLYFGPHAPSGIYYPSVIVEVTPEEFEAIQHDPASLPNGWTLGEEFPRLPPKAVK